MDHAEWLDFVCDGTRTGKARHTCPLRAGRLSPARTRTLTLDLEALTNLLLGVAVLMILLDK